MTERLFAIALAVSILGLVLLYYAGKHIDPPYCKVSDISMGSLEKNIRFTGHISSIRKFRGGSMLLKIVDNDSIVDVYLSKRVIVNRQPVRGRPVDVIGRIQVYEGRLEVVVENEEWIRFN